MFPQTLSGQLIFILVVISFSALVYSESNNAISESQKSFFDQFSDSETTKEKTITQKFFGLLGLDGIYDWIIKFFNILYLSLKIIVEYIAGFAGIISELPTEFMILFSIISVAIMINIVKLIFMSGE